MLHPKDQDPWPFLIMEPISPFSAFQVFVDLPELRWQGESVEPHARLSTPFSEAAGFGSALQQSLARGLERLGLSLMSRS